MSTIATITNTGSSSILFIDGNNKRWDIAASGTLSLAASVIPFDNVKSALSAGVMTIVGGGWKVPSATVIVENTAASWTSGNVLLAVGQIGWETDTGKAKIGNGRTAWASLPYYAYGYAGLVGTSSSSIAPIVLKQTTTSATPAVATIDGAAAGVGNQFVLANNTSAVFTGQVVGVNTASGVSSTWTFSGGAKRVANAASTAVLAAITPTMVAQDGGASTWAVAVAADTTNGAVKVTVTGAASTNIDWSVLIYPLTVS